MILPLTLRSDGIWTSAGFRCTPGLCVWCDTDYWARRTLPIMVEG